MKLAIMQPYFFPYIGYSSAMSSDASGFRTSCNHGPYCALSAVIECSLTVSVSVAGRSASLAQYLQPPS